jgi:predicted transcriptional regulator
MKANGEAATGASLPAEIEALVAPVAVSSYNLRMTIHPTSELQARLDGLARRTGRDVETLAQEALERYTDYEAWFLEQVEIGLAAAEAGQLLEHDEVVARVERRLQQGIRS